MENIKYFEKMEGCDIKIMKDLRPRTGEKCVGASGSVQHSDPAS